MSTAAPWAMASGEGDGDQLGLDLVPGQRRGKSAAESELANRPSGSSTSSDAIWAKHVEDTRHSDAPLPSLF